MTHMQHFFVPFNDALNYIESCMERAESGEMTSDECIIVPKLNLDALCAHGKKGIQAGLDERKRRAASEKIQSIC
jgi:hypothetical protein